MSNFLLIDSTENSLLATKVDNNVVATTGKELKEIAKEATTKISDDTNTIIVINAEAKIEGEALQDSKATELIYWFRCKHNLKNPIVVFSVFSLSHQLRRNPNHFVLVSHGCYFYEGIPDLEASNFKPLSAFDDLKPFLKPQIDEILGTFRHRYANYSAMALMLEAAGIKPEDFESLKENERFSTFVNSLDYAILTTYFGRNSNPSTLEREVSQKRILLVDDMAEEGWLPILRTIIYNDADSQKLDFVKVITNANGWDESLTRNELEVKIKNHTPHLILLDLRLGDEQGNKPIEELGGYKLLTFLKKTYKFKGVPVIMFTATTKADTVKTLLRAGATAVWTKPGIDEGLSKKEIVKRYEQLLIQIDYTFKQFENLNLGLNEDERSRYGFEQKINTFFKRLEWIRYRVNLIEKENRETIINELLQFTDIIVDTNFFITGYGSNNSPTDRRLDFIETFSNLYCLALLLKGFEAKHDLEIMMGDNSRLVSISQKMPRIVVLNKIIDEVITKAREYGNNFVRDEHGNLVTDQNGNNVRENTQLWLRADIAFFVLRSMYNENLIRTDLAFIANNLCKSDFNLQLTSIKVKKILVGESSGKKGLFMNGDLLKESNVVPVDNWSIELENFESVTYFQGIGQKDFELSLTKKKLIGDDHILIELDRLLIGKPFVIKYGNQYVDIYFKKDGLKPLVLTNESQSTLGKDKIPERLKKFTKEIDYDVWNIKQFNEKMNEIISQI